MAQRRRGRPPKSQAQQPVRVETVQSPSEVEPTATSEHVHPVLARLLQHLKDGTKSHRSVLLYASEYDRVHGTDIASRLPTAP